MHDKMTRVSCNPRLPPHRPVQPWCHQHQAQRTWLLLLETAAVQTAGKLPLTTNIYLTRASQLWWTTQLIWQRGQCTSLTISMGLLVVPCKVTFSLLIGGQNLQDFWHLPRVGGKGHLNQGPAVFTCGLPVKQEPPQTAAVKHRTLPAWIQEGSGP